MKDKNTIEPCTFAGCNCVAGVDQPEYNPLPCLVTDRADGLTIFCFKLTIRQRIVLLLTGKLWHACLTFRQPLQPRLFTVAPLLTEAKERFDTAESIIKVATWALLSLALLAAAVMIAV